MGWHVDATCHLRRPFVFLCISGGTYIYVPICVHTIKVHQILNEIINLIVLKVSLKCWHGSTFSSMGLECPFLQGWSARRLRRCAATLPRLLERTFPGLICVFVVLEAAG